MKQYTSLVAVAAVAVSGCVNYKSFNAGETQQPGAAASSTAATRQGQARPSSTPAVQTSTKPGQASKKQPAPGSAKPTPSGSAATTTGGGSSSAASTSSAPASATAGASGGDAAQSNRGSSSSSSVSSAAVPTPQPTPASRVIKEETTSKMEVISSRPVVGTDAEMGN